jgi:hypothetical protein
MLDEKRIIKAPILYSPESTLEVLKKFDTRFANTSRKYFIFRVSPKIARFIEDASRLLGWGSPIYHNSEERIENIDELMKKSPERHIAICVKGFWRASKRLIRTHVGGSYEPIPKGKRNTTATGQGLTARFCDTYKYTGDMENPDLRPLHFCDLDAIKEYIDWFKNGCDYRNAAYTSSRITSNGRGRIQAGRTKVHPSNVDGLEQQEEEQVPSDYDITELYDNPTALKTYLRTKIPVGNISTYRTTDGKIRYRGTEKELYKYINREEFMALDIYGGINKGVHPTKIAARIMPVLVNSIQKCIGIYYKLSFTP